MQILNINEKIRSIFCLLLLKLKNNNDIMNDIIEYFNNVKITNYKLYTMMVGLMFSDTYTIYHCMNKDNSLLEVYKDKYQIYSEFDDIDDLLFYIEENPLELLQFYFNSLQFHNLPIKIKTNYLKSLNKADDNYLRIFCKTINIEKEHFFGYITALDLLQEYKQYIENNKDKLNNSNILSDMAITAVCEKISILSECNIKAYQGILLSLVRTYYISKSFLRDTIPELLDEKDIMILNFIEQNELNSISYTYNFIHYLISEYIYFYTTSDLSFKQEMDDYFERNSSEKMKIKLKEV